jgi:cobalt-zinc-cadmium efflux system protein
MMHSHSHDHTHSHGHTGHGHGVEMHSRAFAIGIWLNLGFVVAEAVFGLAANSLALLADAGHNFSDVIGLVLAWGGAALAQRRPTQRHTYGFRSASILAAIANAALLLMAVGAIAYEALRRLIEPAEIAGPTVIWVAVAGIAVNGATALMFMRGRKHDLNMRGAFLHMVADAAVSLGVVIATLIVMATGWLWLDPLVSLAIAGVILWTTWDFGRDSINLALGAVPRGIDRDAVESYLRGLPGVVEVHDMHIWAMSTTETALTAHLVRPGAGLDDALLHDARETLAHEFGISHATLQVEQGDAAHPCSLAPHSVV